MNRYESTKKVGLLGIIGNIFLLIIKISVAIISHSEAMLADALNSAGDI
jgi:divalent metal cation (Fe/Co/Zn/Cd) transporter